MIFVSFGNSPIEHSFTRLAEAIDKYAANCDEDIFVQSGNTNYTFIHCTCENFLDHEMMLQKINDASIVITHGGWGTISESVLLGKRIIAVPRIIGKEHYHDQAELVRSLENLGCLLGVYNIDDLASMIEKARTYPFKKLERGSASKIINQSISEWFPK